jgi:outer membrane protein OmpA-like peptidoglycan-associated protein
MNKTNSIGLADMMSALMMVFMFLSIAFLAQLEKSQTTLMTELNTALKIAFKSDLSRWEAEITDDNIVRFHAPFPVGSTDISERFTGILEEFCPRYIDLLAQAPFKESIKQINVAGHTSKGWNSATSHEASFIKNMELSQQRASNVLSFCYLLADERITAQRNWLEKVFHANGLASSHPIYVENNVSEVLSRRVEFTVTPKI